MQFDNEKFQFFLATFLIYCFLAFSIVQVVRVSTIPDADPATGVASVTEDDFLGALGYTLWGEPQNFEEFRFVYFARMTLYCLFIFLIALNIYAARHRKRVRYLEDKIMELEARLAGGKAPSSPTE